MSSRLNLLDQFQSTHRFANQQRYTSIIGSMNNPNDHCEYWINPFSLYCRACYQNVHVIRNCRLGIVSFDSNKTPRFSLPLMIPVASSTSADLTDYSLMQQPQLGAIFKLD